MRLIQQIRGFGRAVVRELIGRAARGVNWSRRWWSTSPTRDWTTRDYKFWDEARQCKTRGLELSGLFLKPLASKVAAWVQGSVPRWSVDSARGTDELVTWWRANLAEIVRTYEDAVALADCYLVINADLTVTVLPPDVVTPIVDEGDYSKIIGWRVREVHPHPDRVADTMTIEDEYYADLRIRTVTRGGVAISRDEYPNLIGWLPVIHVPNNRGSNAVFGEPEAVALLPALMEYGTILEAALTGNKNQSLPTPVAEFEDSQTMDNWWEKAVEIGLVQRNTVTHADGTTETYDEINFQAGEFLALAGAKFDYKHPGNFAEDTRRLLELLFYLILQHTEIPEFAWGNAIASSKASAETQLLPFIKWIEKKRAQCSGWMTEAARVVLAYTSLWEQGINADAALDIGWEPLTDQDGNLTLNALKWLLAEGLIDELTAITLAPVDIPDPESVLQQARKERDERAANDPAGLDFAAYTDEERRRQDAAAADEDQELENAA